MKHLLFIISLTTLLSCQQTEDTFYMPAEWEPHEAVWLGWEEDSSFGFYPAVVDMVKTLTPHVNSALLFQSASVAGLTQQQFRPHPMLLLYQQP
jgi:agmatine deiminase